MNEQALLHGDRPLVVKIGSSILIDDAGRARRDWMAALVGALTGRPGPVVVVSSGAIGLGRRPLGLTGRPTSLADAQAAAAVGQIELARTWADLWSAGGRTAAQVLLTLGDLEDRGRYLNARNTFETLLERGVVPIVNENDTVATGEIRFGDNDRLAARTAQLVGAELLVLLSDVDGLYDADPGTTPHARRIPFVEHIDAEIEALAGTAASTGFGTGGMVTKIEAAKIATAAGCPVLLTSGRHDEPFDGLDEGRRGTWFAARQRPLAARKQWLRGLQQHEGRLTLDAGAAGALKRGASLLARGLVDVDGDFPRGALVRLDGPDGAIGQGLSGYASDDVRAIRGAHSERFHALLGYSGRGPVIHRDDLVLFEPDEMPP
ncbi:glutamate 5-kinase [Wenzhouxiangella sp. XN79A]|uniref:glutamate 5-kinase n=1 Tax=Wenzhouxiangella sp. XN79A TaxID=2724193 RepID=UPI00144A95F6|nr:glutamate 5-kinase [Wenzhouxiangella sp. XN79A]NKI35631.1 glutamate 5-kinase [Wenzhouxiangella sp. XN79A]